MDLTINEGSGYTNSRNVIFRIDAMDLTSGCKEISICSDGSNWGDWMPFRESIPYVLEGEEGTKTIVVRIRDEAGNQIESDIDASIILDLTSPSVVDPTPAPDQLNVSLDSWIVVKFDEEVLFDPKDGAPIMVFDSKDRRIDGEIDFWNLSSIVSFIPEELLDPFERYRVVINPEIRDEAGNSMASEFSYHFTTVGVPPPRLEEVSAFLDDLNVTIFWSEPANEDNLPIDGYRIYRKTGEVEEMIFEGGPGAESHVDRNVEPGIVYFYSISAFNEFGASIRSSEVRIEVPELQKVEPPVEEPVDDDDEEPIIEDRDKDGGGVFSVVIVVLIILLFLAVIAGVGAYLFIKNKDPLEENQEKGMYEGSETGEDSP